MSIVRSDPDMRGAQKLRLQRTMMGCITYGCMWLIATAYYVLGFVDLRHLLEFSALILLINAMFLGIIASGFNLRFKDPSLTWSQVFCALWPTIYILYFVNEPEARAAMLFMGLVAVMFGAFALDFRQMLTVGGAVLASYLVLVMALHQWAPERFDARVQLVMVLAFGLGLLLTVWLGASIGELRRRLRDRNQRLQAAMAELTELATKDPLTRLPNRRSLMEHLEKERSRAERRRPDHVHLCVCMMDVDHFKRFNDTYGHQVGDAVLRVVGEGLQKVLRQGDFVGRFGGEEFLLIFPESTLEGARIAAERVREAVAALRVPDLPEGERVTVSLGVAIHRPGDGVDVTLRRSDDALYRAKESGRDRVVMAEPQPEPARVPGRAELPS